jgi:hypothetical protein
MPAVRKALSIVAAVILTLLGLVLLLWMILITGVPLCSEPLRGADECIDASSGERGLGLVAGWASVVTAVVGVTFAIRLALGRKGLVVFATTAAVTPVLALLGLAFLPISF